VPQERVTVNSPELLMRLARQGALIGATGRHFADRHVRSGELVPLLEDWSLPPATAWAVFSEAPPDAGTQPGVSRCARRGVLRAALSGRVEARREQAIARLTRSACDRAPDR
jgi:DNA-binding transcriptional LysR family regulator